MSETVQDRDIVIMTR